MNPATTYDCDLSIRAAGRNAAAGADDLRHGRRGDGHRDRTLLWKHLFKGVLRIPDLEGEPTYAPFDVLDPSRSGRLPLLTVASQAG